MAEALKLKTDTISEGQDDRKYALTFSNRSCEQLTLSLHRVAVILTT